jgi:hypothetical protein
VILLRYLTSPFHVAPGMIRDFVLPVTTLCLCVAASIAGLDRLCLFHQTYQAVAAQLSSERWLLEQCSDPHFFSKMHQHSNLCFQVNAFLCGGWTGLNPLFAGRD